MSNKKKKNHNYKSNAVNKRKKKSKVVTLISLGIVSFLVFGLIASVSVPESKSVKDETAKFFALKFATSAYVLASIEASSKKEEFNSESVQNKLKELSEDPAETYSVSYDEIGNIVLTMENGTVAYACANFSGYGLGNCATATLSKVMSL